MVIYKWVKNNSILNAEFYIHLLQIDILETNLHAELTVSVDMIKVHKP